MRTSRAACPDGVPRVSATGGFERTVPFTVIRIAVFPRALARGPENSIDSFGVRGIEGDLNRPGVLIFVENSLPCRAAVGGAEYAAHFVRPVGMAEDSDEEAIRIARVHDDGGNLQRVLEAKVRPGGAGVRGFVNAVPDRYIRALETFDAADVDAGRFRRRNRNRVDRAVGL